MNEVAKQLMKNEAIVCSQYKYNLVTGKYLGVVEQPTILESINKKDHEEGSPIMFCDCYCYDGEYNKCGGNNGNCIDVLINCFDNLFSCKRRKYKDISVE